MKAYRAYVTAAKGSTLLGGGGTEHVTSHPFETEDMAVKWIGVVLAANCEAHRRVFAWGWTVVDHPDPIREEEVEKCTTL